MKRPILTTTLLTGLALAGAGWAAAETPPPAHNHEVAPAKPAHGAAAAPDGKGKMGGMDMAGGDNGMCPMMGMGGMHPMGGGMGPMMGMGAMMGMGGADTQVAVKNTDKGVTITLTTTDPAKVARLQKMAEAMRLMHEATAP